MVLVKNFKIVFIVLVIFILVVGSATGCNKLKTKKAPLKSSKTKATVNNNPITPQREITKSEAIATVKRFSRIKGIRSVEVGADLIRVITVDKIIYSLNVKTGKFIGVRGEMVAESVNPRNLPLSRKAAINRAINYVRQINTDINKLTLIDPYDDNDKLRLTWFQIDENQARLYGEVSIFIDPKTGRLFDYISDIQNYGKSTKPKIKKVDAIKIARKLLNKKKRKIKVNSCELIVIPPGYGRGQLGWSINFDAFWNENGKKIHNEDNVVIDALTGEEVNLNGTSPSF